MPDPSAAPQAVKHRRFWLWAPYVLVLIAFIAWSGVWFVASLRIGAELDSQAEALKGRGYTASWSALKVSGWPFRFDLTLTQPNFGDPSGWALAAPSIKGESIPFVPDRWTLVAPDGLTLTRPGKGPLTVSGQAIRASVGALGSAQPRLSFEGRALSFAPGPGGQPSAFASADLIEAHLQPGPDDQAALLIKIEDAKLDPSANLARIAPTLGLTWDARLSHLSALKGADWPGAVKAWTAAGGSMGVAGAKIALGGLELDGSSGAMTVGGDGRLQGSAALKVGKGGGLSLGGLHIGGLNIGGLSFSGSMPLTFADGRASIGAFPIGQALKVY